MPKLSKIKEEIGNKYHRLTVISDGGVAKSRHRIVNCLCDCGKKTSTLLSHLKSGNTKSCGCYSRENSSVVNTKHGYRYHPLYKKWLGIKERCGSKKSKAYKHYGGRGITISPEWINDPKKFIEYCEGLDSYDSRLTIDRINNDKGYEPGNIRFVTQADNNLNKRLIFKSNTSSYRGVIKRKSGCFRFLYRYKGKTFTKSGFNSAIDAAIARDIACIKNKIQLPLNFPELLYNTVA